MLRRNGTVCVHLKASIKTTVTYTTENGTKMKVFNVTSNASVNDEASWCDDKSAVLVLSWEDTYNLSFIFNTSGVTWTEGNVTFQYAVDEEIFPGYNGNSGQGEAVFGNLLHNQTSNIEQQRSFLCNDSQTLYSNDIGTNQTTKTALTVRDFQVQAFYFRNSTSGEFDNGELSSDVPSLSLSLSPLPFNISISVFYCCTAAVSRDYVCSYINHVRIVSVQPPLHTTKMFM